jgi:hypothetical protein
LAITGYVLAIILAAYGLLGGYLRDYAGSCKTVVSGGSSSAVKAFDDFCGNGVKTPPIPPHGPWGWIGLAGFALGLIGLVLAIFRSTTRAVGDPHINDAAAIHGFDPQPDPPGRPQGVHQPAIGDPNLTPGP